MTSAWFDYRNQSSPNQHIAFVTDLSQHQTALMNYQDISDLLTEDQERRLVDYVKVISEMSYDSISKRYDHWKESDRAHDLYVPSDATRFRNKVVIADTRAISDTVLTYFMAAITGRNPMFQLEGLNRESRKASALLERVLHQQMRKTAADAHLAMLFLDSIRYGFAPTKVVWSDKLNTNLLINADPRKTFPDPRVQAGDVQNMQFIVFSEHASGSALVRTGLYPKLVKYPRMLENDIECAGWRSHTWHKEEGNGWNINQTEINDSNDVGYFRVGKSHVVDEAWIVFNGADIGMPGLGQVWMVVAILDERFVIRCQLNPYGQSFPCAIGGFGFDSHKTHQQSLYDLLLPLHNLGTWLLRSRIDNVQSALNNLIFVDPQRVAVHDLINRNPWGVVRTLPGTKPGDGIQIAQIPDVTRGHWQDIQLLGDMKQRLSAASDAQQGMPTSDGIRSATEISRLTQLGSQRLGVLSRIISATTIRPIVRMMVSNVQDALRFNTSLRVSETDANTIFASMAEDGYVDIDQNMLEGEVEYLVVDGTLPVEPTRSPETWLQIMQVVGQAGMQMEYDMGRLVEESIRAMGVPDIDQFKIDQKRQAREGLTPSQKMAIMEKMRGQSSVMPQEQIEQEVMKGNLVPMKDAM